VKTSPLAPEEHVMDRVKIGYVARAHGLRGELRVHLFAPESTTLFDVERVFLGGRAVAVTAARPTTGAVLLSIEGVEDRDAAEALKGKEVEVERADVELAEGEFLLADLPGCAVVDERGAELGRVAEVMPGAQPILVIHGPAGEMLLPAIPAFLRAVDVQARRIEVEVPEDLPVEPIG
jgi:16S rRNA processing protein RimM